MREIKFRINAGTDQQPDIRILSLYEIGDLYTEFDASWVTKILSWAQQYIGRKDKNGKEIYEGDKLLYVEELEGDYACGQKNWTLSVIWENDGWYLLSACEKVGGKFEEFEALEII